MYMSALFFKKKENISKIFRYHTIAIESILWYKNIVKKKLHVSGNY